MKIEEILYGGKDKELKEKLEQLPHTFFNLNTMDVNVLKNENMVELQIQQKSRDWQIEIDLPTLAQDIKVTSYNGEMLTEFYYKKTNYLLRF